MARRYPGPVLPQVMPLFYIAKFSVLENIMGFLAIWAISFGLGVHWAIVPGLYGTWLFTVIPHAFSHMLADVVFEREILTDWAGPIPNILIVLGFFLSPFDISASFGVIFSNFTASFMNQPLLVLLTLTYAFNIFVVVQHLFLPWPADDLDTGLVIRFLRSRLTRKGLAQQ